MKDPRAEGVSVVLRRSALDAIFDECDRHSDAETGGRLVGSYTADGPKLQIDIWGVIEPGPSATRTATSFFQDGAHQERVFRTLEQRHPEIEHLGNWHSHHVNGLPTLSSGDRATYHRIVEHRLHNTDFFYALLVIAKQRRGARERYRIRHFLFRKGDSHEYKIPASRVQIGSGGPLAAPLAERTPEAERSLATTANRAYDQELFSSLQPGLKPRFSKRLNSLVWKGPLVLPGGATVPVAIVEIQDDAGTISYAIPEGGDGETGLSHRSFGSAAEAVWSLERALAAQSLTSAAHPEDRGE